MNCIDAKDLIYNRFDLIYRDIDEIQIGDYRFQVVVLNNKALVNVWGKYFPQEVFDEAINLICEKYNVSYVEITSAYNNYENQLYEVDDIVLYLPTDEKDLFEKLRSKHRYNLRRCRRLIEEKNGRLTIEHFEGTDIDNKIVEQYFEWKKVTHGRDYRLISDEYLLMYHVTDALLLSAGGKWIAVVFYCRVNETVYLENLSYDMECEKYSPGSLVYMACVKMLVSKGYKILYLGGGNYSYKKHFNSVVNKAYSGRVYTEKFYRLLNNYLEKMQWKTYAIYGLGAIGDCFLACKEKIKARLAYGIDQDKKYIENLETYEYDDKKLYRVDVVFITIKTKVEGLEDKLRQKFENVYYWNDMIDILKI